MLELKPRGEREGPTRYVGISRTIGLARLSPKLPPMTALPASVLPSMAIASEIGSRRFPPFLAEKHAKGNPGMRSVARTDWARDVNHTVRIRSISLAIHVTIVKLLRVLCSKTTGLLHPMLSKRDRTSKNEQPHSIIHHKKRPWHQEHQEIYTSLIHVLLLGAPKMCFGL